MKSDKRWPSCAFEMFSSLSLFSRSSSGGGGRVGGGRNDEDGLESPPPLIQQLEPGQAALTMTQLYCNNTRQQSVIGKNILLPPFGWLASFQLCLWLKEAVSMGLSESVIGAGLGVMAAGGS
jgi:hypothetical protein